MAEFLGLDGISGMRPIYQRIILVYFLITTPGNWTMTRVYIDMKALILDFLGVLVLLTISICTDDPDTVDDKPLVATKSN